MDDRAELVAWGIMAVAIAALAVFIATLVVAVNGSISTGCLTWNWMNTSRPH